MLFHVIVLYFYRSLIFHFYFKKQFHFVYSCMRPSKIDLGPVGCRHIFVQLCTKVILWCEVIISHLFTKPDLMPFIAASQQISPRQMLLNNSILACTLHLIQSRFIGLQTTQVIRYHLQWQLLFDATSKALKAHMRAAQKFRGTNFRDWFSGFGSSSCCSWSLGLNPCGRHRPARFSRLRRPRGWCRGYIVSARTRQTDSGI